MIKVDESDPVGELEPSFPFKDITIRRGVDMKEHYELQSEIGRGKFGTVFKCREKATGLMLAAKFVGIAHKQDRRNVEREVEIMCELQHPRLIQLYDAFEANNAMCFILELVEGGELFERVIGDDFVLTEKAVTIFMRQICEGVQFIHSKNILHLDLKPENILCLTKTGNRIKIIDFGLARKFNPENKLQVLFGTPEFVAPEVVNFDAIGFGTDMWSVGVICYVLLSGLSPFMGETDVETMANVTIAQYDFDDEAFDSISNDAKDFIKKLLVKDHKGRPSATECLSHRWLQKKKPKKMVRKSSSKILAKQTAEVVAVKPEPSQPPNNRQDASPSLDVSKDNLKEFCSKSRSLSPADVAVVAAPTLAQLRIQKDSKSSSASQGRKNDDGQGSSTVLCAKKTDEAPPQETSGVQKQMTPDTAKQLQSPVLQLQGTSGVQQHTTSGQLQQQQQQQRDEPETRKGSSPVTSRSAAVDVPPQSPPRQEVAGGLQRAWLDTNHNNCSLLRRSSDVSYMFSSFRTTTTTMSTSGFLGATELQGLSDRLQNLQSIFDDRDRAAAEVGGGGGGSSLHKLLLNRQHLTAAVADRKPKFKMSQLNRDVPFGSPPPASNLLYYMTSSSSCRSAPHSKRASPEHETVSTKEMLLKLFYGSGGGGGDKAPESKVST